MPFAIDEEAMRKRSTLDVSQRDGTPTGIPVKQIPHAEFPRVVYKHPKEPFRKIEHRNANHELVNTETVPSEHLTRTVQDETELKRALKDGWVLKPYIPQAPPDPNAHLYSSEA